MAERVALSSAIVKARAAAFARTAIEDEGTRNSLLLVANGLILGGGGFVFWFISARLFSPATIGIASAGTSMVMLLSSIGHLGFGFGIIRYADALGPRRALRLTGAFGATILVSSAIGAIFSQLAPTIAHGLTPAFASRADMLLFAASCAGAALSYQYDCYLISRRSMGLVVVKNSIGAAARALLIIIIPDPSVALLIGITGLSGLLSIIIVAPIVARFRVRACESEVKTVGLGELVGYSLWNCITALAPTLPSLVLPIIIVTATGAVQAGAFYLAWSLFSTLLLVPTALSFSGLAERSGKTHSDLATRYQDRRSDQLMGVVTILFLPVALLVLVFLGPTYVGFGASVFLALVAGIWPYHRAFLLMTAIRVRGSQRNLAAAFTISQIMVILLSIPMLRLLGVTGAALAWTVGQFCLLAMLRRRVYGTIF